VTPRFAALASLRIIPILAGFCLVGTGASAQTRDVAGRVLAADDSTALPGVRITVLETGLQVSSDAEGSFTLRGVPTSALRLALERVGVRQDTVDLPAGITTITVYVGVTAVQIRPLITTAESPNRERFEAEAQPSTVTLQPREISAVPTIGEPDVLRVVQLLPGTVAKNDFTSTLNVRGGESDQNLVLLDGITLFNPYHVGGMFSTFDNAAINTVDFTAGAFSAAYPGRLSSVLDVSLRQGRNDRIGINAMLSGLSAKLLVEGPIPGTAATFMIGGRRSYADRWVDAFTDESFLYYFGDLTAKLSLPLPTDGVISLVGYAGRDVGSTPWLSESSGQEPVDLEFDWGNTVAGLYFEQPIGNWWVSQRVNVTRFTTGIGLVPDVFDARNKTTLWSAATNVGAQLGTHRVQVGGSLEPYTFTYRAERPQLETVVLDQAWAPTVWGVYAEDQWNVAPWLFVRPGIRGEYVEGTGRMTWAPRLSAKAFVTENFAINGSIGRFYQPIHSIRDQELPVSFFEFWIGADSVTPIGRSDQGVLGVEVWPRDDWSFSVEGYTKSYEDIVMRDRADDPKVQGDEFFITRGYSWGVDVLVRKHFGPLTGWVAYSYAKSLRRLGSLSFAPGHDRRHTVDVVLQTPGPFGSQLGLRWGYGSPLPYTGIIGSWPHRRYNSQENQFDDFESEVLSASINDQRFPPYHRLDASIRWELGTNVKWRPFFQVVNVYNRQNVFFYTYDFTGTPARRGGFSQLPIVPTLGVEVEW